MDRPIGITILAVLCFLFGGFMVLGGLAVMLGMGAAGATAGATAGGPEATGAFALLAGMGAVLGVIFFLAAALYLLMGWGLWKLKNWARIIYLVLAGIGLLFGVLGVAASLISFEIVTLVTQLVPFAINALIVWYMLTPNVKRAFGAA